VISVVISEIFKVIVIYSSFTLIFNISVPAVNGLYDQLPCAPLLNVIVLIGVSASLI